MSDTKGILESPRSTAKSVIPLETRLASVEPFLNDMLPPDLLGYVADVAERTQSPIEYSAVSVIVMVSSIIGAKFTVRPKQLDNWTVAINQWGALIGPPSSMKSPALKEALKPITAIEKENAAVFKAKMDDTLLLAELSKIDEKAAKAEAEALYKEGHKEEALVVLREAKPEAVQSKPERITINDTTVEKLGELLNENPNGMVVVRDELSGLIAKLSREDSQLDRAFLLECFDGLGRFTYDRIGRGTIVIDNCMLSILGGIQPSKIAILVRQAMRGNKDDGLIQRLQLTVWPDPISNWEWKDRAPSKPAYEAYYKVLHTFHDIPITDHPTALHFSSEAQPLFAGWMKELQNDIRSDDYHSVVQSHLAKMPKTIAALALQFELIGGGRNEVGVKALSMALKWYPFLKSHALRLYSIAVTSSIEDAKRILRRRSKLGEIFTCRDVRRKGWAGLTEMVDVTAALDCLVDHRYLIEQTSSPSASGGRPTTHYCWSPALGETPLKTAILDTPKPAKPAAIPEQGNQKPPKPPKLRKTPHPPGK